MITKLFSSCNNGDYSYLIKIPEKDLWMAVLDTAIHDIEFYAQEEYVTVSLYHQRRICVDAIRAFNWMHTETTIHKLYSFPWTCSVVFPECYKEVIDYYRKRTANVKIDPPKVTKKGIKKSGKYRINSTYPVQIAPNLLPFLDDRVFSPKLIFEKPLVLPLDNLLADPCLTANLMLVLDRCNQPPDHIQHTPSYLPSILQLA